jgi:hypothetical protein
MRFTAPESQNPNQFNGIIVNGKHIKNRMTIANQSSIHGNPQNCLSTTNLLRSENE